MENTLTRKPEMARDMRGWMWLAVLAALLVGLAAWMIASQVGNGLAEQRHAQAQAAFEAETGIRVVRVVMTAGGGMVDLQYQILDPDKSLIVHDDDNPPTLVDEASSLTIATPLHDHNFRELHTGVTYHELIMNGGGLLERGSRVTLTVGDSRLEHVVVQ